ncbi:MAG TPA: outer membrane lipoprotein chaperone LolA [Steroidobacteraceae bacterium]|nr:outer membrane lipoprotein chaperone LolA [Steroidobacteraceae bacterium]
MKLAIGHPAATLAAAHKRHDFCSPLAALAVLRVVLSAAMLLSVAPASAATGTGPNPLERFLMGLHSFRASFSQTITDAHGHPAGQSTGMLVVLRPGKFRWEIHAHGEHGAGQLVVDDGRNLWYYDPDLAQVEVKPSGAALPATPAMLLSEGDALGEFQVQRAGASRGLDWVRVVPKAADADFRDALLGFSGTDLRRMILRDKLGETTTLDFDHAERNGPVAASEVSFTPPPGADLIGTPEK